MRSNVFDNPFGRSTKYQHQTYNSDEDMSQDYMKTFVDNIRQQVFKNRKLYTQSNKKSSSKKKSKRQPTSDDEKFPWGDRYKGKTKEKQLGKNYISQKQKLKTQQKSIQYETIFSELCYGNSTDQVSAAFIYKDILESIVIYLMNKELQMDTIFSRIKNFQIKKLQQEGPSKGKKRAVKDSTQIKQEKPKQKVQSEDTAQPEDSCKQTQLQIPDSQLEQSIEVPFNQAVQKKDSEIIGEQGAQNKVIRPFQSDEQFVEDFKKFKRCSCKHSTISLIPYKAIPSLFLVSMLNFIISKTAQPIVSKYFSSQDPHYEMYKELHQIAESSKKYLMEEKLLKGLNYIDEVEERLNKIYINKGFKPKTVVKPENRNTQTIKQDAYKQREQRKSSTRSEQSPIVEESKEQPQ